MAYDVPIAGRNMRGSLVSTSTVTKQSDNGNTLLGLLCTIVHATGEFDHHNTGHSNTTYRHPVFHQC